MKKVYKTTQPIDDDIRQKKNDSVNESETHVRKHERNGYKISITDDCLIEHSPSLTCCRRERER